MLTNFQIDKESFMDKFEAAKFNLAREIQGQDTIFLIDRVISKIQEDLLANAKKINVAKSKPITKTDKNADSPQETLKFIEEMRQKKVETLIRNAKPEER